MERFKNFINLSKKYVALGLAVTLTLGVITPLLSPTSVMASANSNYENMTPVVPINHAVEFTLEDVLTLEPFISVNEGLFELDATMALHYGIDENLINFQNLAFNHLNNKITNGELTANEDLSITDPNNKL